MAFGAPTTYSDGSNSNGYGATGNQNSWQSYYGSSNPLNYSAGARNNALFNQQGYDSGGWDELLPRAQQYGQYLNPAGANELQNAANASGMSGAYYSNLLQNLTSSAGNQGLYDQARAQMQGQASDTGSMNAQALAAGGYSPMTQSLAQVGANQQALGAANNYATGLSSGSVQAAQLPGIIQQLQSTPNYNRQMQLMQSLESAHDNRPQQQGSGILGSLAGIAGTLAGGINWGSLFGGGGGGSSSGGGNSLGVGLPPGSFGIG